MDTLLTYNRPKRWRAIAPLLLAVWIALGTFVGTAADAVTNKIETKTYNNPIQGLGSWIWTYNAHNFQVCQFWRSFEIPASSSIKSAMLFITADDEFTLSLDGIELGRGAEWQDLFQFDLSQHLAAGRHVLAISALNTYNEAGVILGLRVVMTDGRVIEVKSDESWSIVPDRVIGWEKQTRQSAAWPAAKIVGNVRGEGPGPWWLTPEGLGSWIWMDIRRDNQTCQFWRSFEIPASSSVKSATLLVTADDEYIISLDGRELGRGSEWKSLFRYDLSQHLAPGRHILTVTALNVYAEAGMIMGLRVVMADGRFIDVKSDESWSIVPENVLGWEKQTNQLASWPAAKVVRAAGAVGIQPWWLSPMNIIVMPKTPPLTVSFWQTGWFQITLLSVCGLVILISFRLTAQLVLHQKEQELLRRERARIARDIHDDIGARMTELVLHGELAQNEVPEDSEARQQLDLICAKARGLLSAMDEVLWAVNPQRDTLRDFAVYVISYAQKFLKHTEIQCLFEVDPEISKAPFNLPLRRSLLMAIKEAFNNTVKHSGATEIHLKIQWLGERLVVVVEDNGRGYDPATTKPGRNGLGNMAQRMKELDGICLVTSQPGKGCRVELSIPLMHTRGNSFAWIWNAKRFSQQLSEPKKSDTKEHAQNHDPTQC